MPYTKIQIVNLAMIQLNKALVTSLTTNNDEFTTAASLLLDLLYATDIKDNVYSFASHWNTINPEANVTPPIPYFNFQYTLPSDYIKYIDMWPRFDYQIVSGLQLYTNASPINLKYVFLPPYEDLPNEYVDYLALHLASRLAMSRMQNEALYKTLKEEALEARARASALDGQTNPNPAFTNSRYIAPNTISNIGPTYF